MLGSVGLCRDRGCKGDAKFCEAEAELGDFGRPGLKLSMEPTCSTAAI